MKPIFTFLLVTASVMTTAIQLQKAREYIAPDGSFRVVVVPVSKEPGRSEYESRIDFKSSDGDLACSLDYSSEDNEHGFGVVKAQWTPDSQFFVFSLTSSGGHQAWHAPTQFFSRKDATIRTLDDYVATEITKADFLLVAPNTVKTERLEEKRAPVSVSLSALPPLRSWPKTHPFSIACTGGRVFNPDRP